jgi:nucleotide-binding universal stress UspA family protein
MGKQGLGHIKSGLGSTASYVVENLDGTVMVCHKFCICLLILIHVDC